MVTGRNKIFTALGAIALTACAQPKSAPGWDIVPSMQTGRSEIHAASSDHKIYIAGGIGFFRVLKSCEVFDLRQREWDVCPDLPKRLHHLAMAAQDTHIYASGGYVSLGFKHDPKPMLWRLSPQAKAWEAVSVLPEPLGEHSMVALDGSLYIIGGSTKSGDSNTLWIYDTVSGAWREGAPLPTARNSSAVTVHNGEIWVIGGRSEAGGSRLNTVEIYTPETESWRTSKPLPQGRGGHVAVSHKGKIHVFGGEVFNPNKVLNRYDIFDPVTNEWTKGTPPPHPRHGGAAITSGENIILIGGGARPGTQTIFSVSGTTQILSATDLKEQDVEP